MKHSETFKDYFFGHRRSDVPVEVCLENDDHTRLLSLIKRRTTIYRKSGDGEHLHRLTNSIIESLRKFTPESLREGVEECFERKKNRKVVFGIIRELLDMMDRSTLLFEGDGATEELSEDLKDLREKGKLDPKC